MADIIEEFGLGEIVCRTEKTMSVICRGKHTHDASRILNTVF